MTAHAIYHIIADIMFGFGEVRQDITRNAVFMSWMANTEPNAVKIWTAAEFVDRPQAIVSCEPAASFDTHLTGREVQLIMQNDYIGEA